MQLHINKKENTSAVYLNNNGYTTVYISLSLGLLVVFIVTMLTFARNQAIRMETECAMDLSLNSVLAEYNREMLKQYKLLFIDSSYGMPGGGSDNTRKRILNYMALNFNESGSKGIPSGLLQSSENVDLTGLRADNATLSEVSYASDNCGEVLRYQIDRYMKQLLGISIVDKGLDSEKDLDTYIRDYEGYCGERDGYDGRINEIMNDLNSNLEEDEEPYSLSNPADSVDRLRPGSALYYAISDSSALHLKNIDTSAYISHRGYTSGYGLRAYQEKPEDTISKQLFYEYIFDNCGFYMNEKPDSALSYEIEYLISGNGNDMDNMEDIAGFVFMTRYAINMSHLLSSGSKQSEAEAMALAATSAIALPELTEAVKWSIIFAWGYAESAKDMRILYDGHGLDYVKTDATWNTPLEQMINFEANLDSYSPPQGNLTYQEYLRLLIMSKNIDDITLRLMDVMEMDIALTQGNSNFRMDKQIYQFFAKVSVSSSFGYGCSIRRFATYE